MPDVDLNFSREEYSQRIAKARGAMERQGIELLIVTDPSNMAWLTGYDGWSFYVHQCVLLTLEGDPVWYGRSQDAFGAKRTVFMDEAEHPLLSRPLRADAGPPRRWIISPASSRRRAGTAAPSASRWTTTTSPPLVLPPCRSTCPNARFKDATGLVNWQRAVKSEQELVYMRRAARIVEAMHARIQELIEPGLRKNELVAEIYHTGITGVDGHGGDYPGIVPLLPTGKDASAPHLTWDDKPFETGAGTFFEIAGVHRRYHCPLCRTVYLGTPPQDILDAEQALLEGLAAGLEVAKPGNTCEDIAAAFLGALKRHGIEKDTRNGYPIGLSYPPDWGERTMSLRLGDDLGAAREHDLPFHARPLVRRLGPGDHREHRDHRHGHGDPGRRAPQALREGLT